MIIECYLFKKLLNNEGDFIDMLDFVRDPISSHDYYPAEDPKLFRSEKTKRGPLTDNWLEEFVREGKPVMCE